MHIKTLQSKVFYHIQRYSFIRCYFIYIGLQWLQQFRRFLHWAALSSHFHFFVFDLQFKLFYSIICYWVLITAAPEDWQQWKIDLCQSWVFVSTVVCSYYETTKLRMPPIADLLTNTPVTDSSNHCARPTMRFWSHMPHYCLNNYFNTCMYNNTWFSHSKNG